MTDNNDQDTEHELYMITLSTRPTSQQNVTELRVGNMVSGNETWKDLGWDIC